MSYIIVSLGLLSVTAISALSTAERELMADVREYNHFTNQTLFEITNGLVMDCDELFNTAHRLVATNLGDWVLYDETDYANRTITDEYDYYKCVDPEVILPIMLTDESGLEDDDQDYYESDRGPNFVNFDGLPMTRTYWSGIVKRLANQYIEFFWGQNQQGGTVWTGNAASSQCYTIN